jgi:site-specific recombinase XerD
MPMDTCSALADFLAYLDAERGFSPRTQHAYASDLSQFVEFAGAQGAVFPDGVSAAVVRSWIVAMKQRGLAGSSIARHVYALRSFWRFLQESDLVSHDPLRRISVPKRKQTVPTCLTIDEVRLLLAAAGEHRNPVVAARDRAIVTTLVFTGLRRGELLDLRMDDFSVQARVLRVRQGKGGKGRVVPVVGEVLAAIEAWLELRPGGSHDYVFATVCGNRIHPSRLQIIWERVRNQSGVTREGVSLHTLRHTFATLLLRSGTDLVTIQKLLGHSRLETTAVYLHADAGDLRSGVERHPLAVREAEVPAVGSTTAPAATRYGRAWRVVETGGS